MDPDRAGELQRHGRELALENRHQMQAFGHLALDLGVEVAAVAGRQIEQVQRRDVHRRLRRFQEQKCCVDGTQGLHEEQLLLLAHATGRLGGGRLTPAH